MIGKKAARIKVLEEQNAKRSDLDQYLPLAADIARRVDAEVANPDAFIPFSIEAILGAAEDEHRIQRFLKLFGALPADKRLEFLLQSPGVNGDKDLLQAALDDELERIKAKSGLNAFLDKSREERRIDLSLIPVGSQVRFYMYEGDDFQYNPKPSSMRDDFDFDVRIEARHDGAGDYSIINIYADDEDSELQDGFTANKRYKLGTLIGEEIDPTVHFGASLHFQDEKGIHAVNAECFTYLNNKYKRVQIPGDINLKLGRVKVAKEEAFYK